MATDAVWSRRRNIRSQRPLAALATAGALPATLLATLLACAATAAPVVAAGRVSLPVTFEANRGQVDERVDFLARQGGYTLFLEADAATLALEPAGGLRAATLRMVLEGGDPAARPRGEDPLATRSHYLVGSDPSRWRRDVPHFARVRYREVYPSIDALYYQRAGHLEVDFVVAPGGDPSTIRLGFAGASGLAIGGRGELVVASAAGELVLPAPVASQDAGRPVEVAFRLVDARTVGFEIGPYDEASTLVIDPPLEYSTFLGGTGADVALDVAVDGSGHAYLTGWTASADFPTTAGVFQETQLATTDAFVAKIDPSGSVLLWSTYLSGQSGALGQGIAVDSHGRPAIIGRVGPTSDLFTTDNSVQDTVGLSDHVFVAQLSADGSTLVYSTFLSGTGGSVPGGIAIGEAEELFVAGGVDGTGFPTLGAYQPTHGGTTDAFVARLDPDSAPSPGSSLVYSTFLGSWSGEIADSIAADDSGRAYVTGRTKSVTDPLFPTKNATQPSPGGEWDAFAAKLDTNATGEDSLVYSTFLGGSAAENGGVFDGGIGIDAAGSAYVGGTTSSTDFPTSATAAFPDDLGSTDAFLVKLDPSGARVWSTYLGGNDIDDLADLAVDPWGRIGFTGVTLSSDLPTIDAFQPTRTETADAYLGVMAGDGSALVWLSHLGGDAGVAEEPGGVTFGVDGALYTAGGTAAGSFQPFPTTPGSLQPINAGERDAYLVKVPVLPPAHVDPPFADLERLRAESETPVSARFERGFPRRLTFDLTMPGDDAVAAARMLVDGYRHLFGQALPPLPPGAEPPVRSELHVQGEWQDDGGLAVTFHQTLDGLPVIGARLAVAIAEVEGELHAFHAVGALAPAQPFDSTPAITAAEAETIAAAHLGRPVVALLGETILAVHEPSLSGGEVGPRAVWKVGLDGPPHVVLVDANDSAVLVDYTLVYQDAGISGLDLYFQDANGDSISNTNCFNPTTVDDFIGDEDGVISAYSNDVEAITEWSHLVATYLFFHDSFNRHSWDDSHGEVEAYVYSGAANAAYVSSCGMEFRQGWASWDVTVHEFTHGVIDFTSELAYLLQPGALNESYSDVMGAIADNQDWLLAEDRTSGLGAIRSLADPLNGTCGIGPAAPNCGDPDRMSLLCTSDAQCNFTNDSGGVHTNSGIPNKAHYLMASGGTFNGFTVGGMGRTKMGRLAYSVMRLLPTWAQFEDARDMSVSTALMWKLLNQNGFTDANLCTVRNAWAAVEIGLGDMDCDGVEEAASDLDSDGILDPFDNCPMVANVNQSDVDMDGIGDLCDVDDDQDGCPLPFDTCPMLYTPCNPAYGGILDNDGDGQGDPCDGDDDNDDVPDGIDNCPFDPNALQLDSNGNGIGDVCDPDPDGDLVTGTDDNCPFVANADQTDNDGDGNGDACDDCPDVADNTQIYTVGFEELGIPPEPYQPDSDGDGIPDACDPLAFATVGLASAGDPYNPAYPPLIDGIGRQMSIVGPAGGRARIELPVCSGDDADVLPAARRVEILVQDLPDTVAVSLRDRESTRIGRLGPNLAPVGRPAGRGLWLEPDCARDYFLTFELGEEVSSPLPFTLTLDDVANLVYPWRSPGAGGTEPDPIPDADGDSQPDAVDNCPDDANPSQEDADGDGAGDACEVPADLRIVKGNGQDTVVAGEPTTYTVVASNLGPGDVLGATVSDPLPAGLACSWSCVPAGGAACTDGPVDGDLVDTADLPIGASASYTLACQVAADAIGFMTNRAEVIAPPITDEIASGDNAAVDVDEIYGPCGHPNGLVLDQQTIDTALEVAACLRVTLGGELEVVAPGHLTVEVAGGSVVLAPGFRVGSGGRLTVRTTPEEAR